MLPVKDDSNDELFRKAAADYFLAADNPDWATFIDQLKNSPDPAIEQTPVMEEPGIARKNKWRPGIIHKLRLYRNAIRQSLRFDWWPGKNKKKLETAVYPCMHFPWRLQFLLQAL